jgi:hypothetical protein
LASGKCHPIRVLKSDQISTSFEEFGEIKRSYRRKERPPTICISIETYGYSQISLKQKPIVLASRKGSPYLKYKHKLFEISSMHVLKYTYIICAYTGNIFV